MPVTMLHLPEPAAARRARSAAAHRLRYAGRQGSRPSSLGANPVDRDSLPHGDDPLVRQQGTEALNLCLGVGAGQCQPKVVAGPGRRTGLRGGHRELPASARWRRAMTTTSRPSRMATATASERRRPGRRGSRPGGPGTAAVARLGGGLRGHGDLLGRRLSRVGGRGGADPYSYSENSSAAGENEGHRG